MSHVFTYELKTSYSQCIYILSVSDYNYISLLLYHLIKELFRIHFEKKNSKRICKENISYRCVHQY